MTDPSYAGQMVCFTAVHVGNTGINADDMESSRAWLDGAILRSLSPLVSSHRSEEDLSAFCARQNVIGISEIDTRALTRRIRDAGAMPGVICTDASVSDEQLRAAVASWTLDGKDMIKEVSTTEKYVWAAKTDEEWSFYGGAPGQPPAPAGGKPYKVVAFDFGIKRNILRRLASYGCETVVVPAGTSAAEVLAMKPDGVFLSNGPGDPSAVPYAVNAVKLLLTAGVPMFGICMGHQVLAQALGGETYKMKFGHHAGNHPIRNVTLSPSFPALQSGRVEVSAQNHNYAVRQATLPAGVTITHTSLNDGSVAGFCWEEKRCMGIQYHPEAAPGPHDSDANFAPFVRWMAEARK